jgi:thioredoxin reductase (NADPH)
VAEGEVLFHAGEEPDELFVVLEGEVDVRADATDEVVLLPVEPGGFVGELNLLTGQRRFLTARVTRAGRVSRTPRTSTLCSRPWACARPTPRW